MGSPGRVRLVRVVCALVVALPAVGLGLRLLFEGLVDQEGPPENRAFHLGLGLMLLLLFVVSLIAVRQAATVVGVLRAGTAGFLAALVGAVLAELLGPPVLLVLTVAVASWAAILAAHLRRRACRASAST